MIRCKCLFVDLCRCLGVIKLRCYEVMLFIYRSERSVAKNVQRPGYYGL